jgi:G3E family GTPase
VTQLPDGIIRAKGVLYLAEAPEQRFVFQLVGNRWTLKPGGDWAGRKSRSQLVMIGLPGSIDSGWVQPD